MMVDSKAGAGGPNPAAGAEWPDDARVISVLHESTAAGFSWVDLQGRFLRVNSGLCRMLGYSEQELLTMAFADVTYSDDQGIGPAIFERTRSGEYHTSTFEKRYIRRDGELIWVLVSPTLIVDDQGRPEGYATITLDITERKRTQEALQRSEERFRTYVGAAPDGVFVVDGEGRYVEVNEAACLMTGYSRAELLSMSMVDLLTDEHREGLAIRMQELVRTGRLRREATLRRSDGTPLPVAIDAVQLSGDRRMAFCKDISARIEAEEARRAIEERLQRTQQLESLGVLAGGIAHDFNNLLVGVLANAEFLGLHTPASSPAHAPLGDIVRAAERAADLCQQMLAYAGKASVATVDLDLSQAVQEMVGLLGSAISTRASVEYDLTADLAPIHADAAQVRQVIMNLLTNAAESKPDGDVKIEIATGVVHCDRAALATTYLANDLPEGRYVYLQVKDDGLGIDPETRRRMFDPFFTTKPDGRGLGLAALLGIMSAHGGAVHVESSPGRGTTLRVIFPEAAAQAPRACGGPHISGARWTASGTALLVDDEPLVRGAICTILETLGFQVITAAGGVEALLAAEARVGELSCVLLDYSMPGMKGDEFLAKLRAIDPDVPALVFSGFSDQGLEAAFAGLSVGAFLQKPFRVSELTDKLEQVLGG